MVWLQFTLRLPAGFLPALFFFLLFLDTTEISVTSLFCLTEPPLFIVQGHDIFVSDSAGSTQLIKVWLIEEILILVEK